MYRTTSKEVTYQNSRKTEEGCYFCNPIPESIVKTFKNFYVAKNNYPYDIWDYLEVSEHLLLVPKAHMTGFKGMDKDSREEYFNVITDYSEQGYDVFTRATNSLIKTQPHLHTHLIKRTQKRIKNLKYQKDPYNLDIDFVEPEA
ncbi:MAG: hypothetical protein A2700_00570 [Candidatus Blackburnbacteria bacterium RIFCSPHIGHO2_01_FULL_44_64]|uniref:HIT domain-containing protein n=1 Tax=Candidatus Blackburnbacteria bacterium RIFCSPHIGHO2_02_FULL_44_20 TaxID=1797516 RepID=A0A1G1V9B4_9BACT|nr:MAG: hypothetical protein A2700_00570 [Candidatus Blackburnbacteria bacterium RIFCSPHIGHO2_01_FULL_44_64]OGY10167.1 MAG: hypothetical protein A3E16_02885 [Candidatus Blackburnbacteria bacterium RIFCSPHIGHO2_12_FULL_44_25]OGY12015.1 MAG: hypothetical protein A3D26_00635 [Candidatus Blackburnbacteria bacterium RIFCSPHIGHO2_02_FULL_44_20]OGY14539.1 MAG: hypothetical protein A3A62_03410 [Candidatus Blackburnbacteria bacterium RIFCSPLOWO2_01_FULL_44_43]OGY17456.1 MAG: hypothetical protein A3H88_0